MWLHSFLSPLVIIILLQAGEIIFPGSDYALILRTVSRQGKSAGIITALGLGVGCFLVVVLSVLGLNSLLLKVPTLSDVIRYAGAIWLLYQAVLSFLPKHMTGVAKKSGSFLSGVVNHALNIEMIIFYVAIVSQLTKYNVSVGFQLLVALEMGAFTALWFILISRVASKIPDSERVFNLLPVRLVIGGLFLFSAVGLIRFG